MSKSRTFRLPDDLDNALNTYKDEAHAGDRSAAVVAILSACMVGDRLTLQSQGVRQPLERKTTAAAQSTEAPKPLAVKAIERVTPPSNEEQLAEANRIREFKQARGIM